jgi:hypothetical protein
VRPDMAKAPRSKRPGGLAMIASPGSSRALRDGATSRLHRLSGAYDHWTGPASCHRVARDPASKQLSQSGEAVISDSPREGCPVSSRTAGSGFATPYSGAVVIRSTVFQSPTLCIASNASRPTRPSDVPGLPPRVRGRKRYERFLYPLFAHSPYPPKSAIIGAVIHGVVDEICGKRDSRRDAALSPAGPLASPSSESWETMAKGPSE